MVTKRPLSYWVKTSNLKMQSLVLVLIAVMVAARLVPLEMQKKIVNQAIKFQKVDLLLLYCGYYLAAVCMASGLKYIITVLQTKIGQETLARIRKELYAHILCLPLSFFQKSSPGMVVSALVTEVTNAGEFVGQAVSILVANVLTLIAFVAYMFYLNPLLAVLSLATYPVVILLVPRLQRKSNEANRMRVDITRQISSQVDEAISGIHEVHGNAGQRLEESKFGAFVDQLLKIRIIWIMYRNGAKVINNFFQSLGPFLLFLVGGFLAIRGRFDLGALVAFLSAYEKLYDPWKELMDFYQLYQDAAVSYGRIMEYFDTEPGSLLESGDQPPCSLVGEISLNDTSVIVQGGVHLLRRIDLDLKPGESIALVGYSGSGKSTLARCICQLQKYTSGAVKLGGREVSELTKSDIAKTIGIVAQSPFIFDGTIKENLLYSCEALRKQSGSGSQERVPSLDALIQVTQQVGIFLDVLRFGMNMVLQAGENHELLERLVRARQSFQATCGEDLSDLVEFYREEKYLRFSSIADNIIFGVPVREDFKPDKLPENPHFLKVLDGIKLRIPLIALGRDLALMAVDILGDLPPDDVFFQNSPISIIEFKEYKTLVSRIRGCNLEEITKEDCLMLLRLGLRFTCGKHKTVVFSHLLEDQILRARSFFKERAMAEFPNAITFYSMTDYIHGQSILENILFGKTTTEYSRAQERIYQGMIKLLVEDDLLEAVVDKGMSFRVGNKGERLSGGQRQKLAIARVLLKRPPVLVLDEATSALDNASQQRIQKLLDTICKGKTTLISVVHRLDIIKGYDKVAVMKSGKIAEIGSYDDLLAKKGMLYELINRGRTAG